MEVQQFRMLVAAIIFMFFPITYLVYQYGKTVGKRTCPSVVGRSPPTTRVVPQATSPVTNGSLISPTKSADLQSILSYLLQRRTYLNGAPYNSDILKALGENWNWAINNQVEPPTAMYQGATKSSYWLLWDDKTNVWDVTTLSPYQHL